MPSLVRRTASPLIDCLLLLSMVSWRDFARVFLVFFTPVFLWHSWSSSSSYDLCLYSLTSFFLSSSPLLLPLLLRPGRSSLLALLYATTLSALTSCPLLENCTLNLLSKLSPSHSHRHFFNKPWCLSYLTHLASHIKHSLTSRSFVPTIFFLITPGLFLTWSPWCQFFFITFSNHSGWMKSLSSLTYPVSLSPFSTLGLYWLRLYCSALIIWLVLSSTPNDTLCSWLQLLHISWLFLLGSNNSIFFS